jgi:two-component system, LytTR family, sensor kinase
MTTLRHRLPAFAAILCAWFAFGAITAAQSEMLAVSRGEAPSRLVELLGGPAMQGAMLWALYTPFVVAAARRLRRIREERGTVLRWALFLAAHLLAVVVVIAVDVPLWAALRRAVDGVSIPLSRVFVGTLLLNVLAYVSIVAITEAIDSAARWRERERAALELERTTVALRAQLAESRLGALQSQLHPHFLHNTLNVAAELVHIDPEGADEMLTMLGALLRRSYGDGGPTAPLAEEIAFVQAYGEILARRYHDRVTFHVQVPDALACCEVPSFLLQPLAENAYRHGVEPREGASSVEIVAQREGAMLVLRVIDRAEVAGERQDVQCESPSPSGIGLQNTRERLALLYGDAASLTLDCAPDGATATVCLPLREMTTSRASSVAVLPAAVGTFA